MEIEFPKRTDVLGRIAAQTAKQVIFQKVREAERENIFAEYNDRVGEVINSTVKRFENGDLIVEIGRVEAVPAAQGAVARRKLHARASGFAPSSRASIAAPRGRRSCCRARPGALIKLFEQEVPEIYDGTVMIAGACAKPGDRAKVAVYSRERDVDPVGACVGMKGTRVQAIIRELRGEKIDIVEWSDDPVVFVTNALSPAKVQRVTIRGRRERRDGSRGRRQAALTCDRQEGQNVRLAAKLTGWRIDIKSEEEKRKKSRSSLARWAAKRRLPTKGARNQGWSPRKRARSPNRPLEGSGAEESSVEVASAEESSARGIPCRRAGRRGDEAAPEMETEKS
jgi:N utilization substance protein A